jgi:hypothetical protein
MRRHRIRITDKDTGELLVESRNGYLQRDRAYERDGYVRAIQRKMPWVKRVKVQWIPVK